MVGMATRLPAISIGLVAQTKVRAGQLRTAGGGEGGHVGATLATRMNERKLLRTVVRRSFVKPCGAPGTAMSSSSRHHHCAGAARLRHLAPGVWPLAGCLWLLSARAAGLPTRGGEPPQCTGPHIMLVTVLPSLLLQVAMIKVGGAGLPCPHYKEVDVASVPSHMPYALCHVN